MSTPIANNTEQLQEILDMVINLPVDGGSGMESKACSVKVMVDYSNTADRVVYVSDDKVIWYSDIYGIYHSATGVMKTDANWEPTTLNNTYHGIYTLECLCGSHLIWNAHHIVGSYNDFLIECDDAFTQLFGEPSKCIFRVPSEPGEYSIKFTAIPATE